MSSYYPLTAILWIMPGNEFFGAETLQRNVNFMSSGTLKLDSCSHLDLPLLPWCSWKEPTHVAQLCSPFHCPPSRSGIPLQAQCVGGDRLEHCLELSENALWIFETFFFSIYLLACGVFFVLGTFLQLPFSCFMHWQKYWDVFGVVFREAKQTIFLVKVGWLLYPSCLLKFFIHHFQSYVWKVYDIYLGLFLSLSSSGNLLELCACSPG